MAENETTEKVVENKGKKPYFNKKNGYQKNSGNRPNGKVLHFNKKPNTVPSWFEDYKKDGTIKSIDLGSRICFSTNKLNYEQMDALKTALKDEKDPNHKWVSQSMSKNGWLAVSTFTPDGNKPSEEIKEAVEVFDKYTEADKDIFRIAYGETRLIVDFSKLNLCQYQNGDIIYPYGMMFFSDNKSGQNQIVASVAVIPDRYNKIHNKSQILPITADNWDSAYLNGNFNRSGHFVIFFANEEIEKSKEQFNPVVTTIDIEVQAYKDKSGVSRCTLGRIERTSRCAEDIVEYLVQNVYGRYANPGLNATHFMNDYIFSVGCNPNNFNLDISDKKDAASTGSVNYRFSSNFGANGKDKVRAPKVVEETVEVSEVPVEKSEENMVNTADDGSGSDTKDVSSENASAEVNNKTSEPVEEETATDTQNVEEEANGNTNN